MSRCQGCPVDPSLACHALVAGLYHWCLQQLDDPALSAHIAAESRPGCEPERRPPTRSGKPRLSLGVNQRGAGRR